MEDEAALRMQLNSIPLLFVYTLAPHRRCFEMIWQFSIRNRLLLIGPIRAINLLLGKTPCRTKFGASKIRTVEIGIAEVRLRKIAAC